MQVAIDQHSEIGVRAGRILLAERRLTGLGLIGKKPRREDDRLHRAGDLTDYDILVSDETEDPEAAVHMAVSAGISCVLLADGDDLDDSYGETFADAGRTLLIGANLAAGIAPALVSHETARGGEILEVTVAWTEPGTAIRRGTPMPFPDPVGARWARSRRAEAGYEAFVAPVPGDWAAAIARVTSVTDGGVVTRVVGVADLAPHLEALALASGVISLDEYPTGCHRPAWAAEAYLAAALEAGLGVATYSLQSD